MVPSTASCTSDVKPVHLCKYSDEHRCVGVLGSSSSFSVLGRFSYHGYHARYRRDAGVNDDVNIVRLVGEAPARHMDQNDVIRLRVATGEVRLSSSWLQRLRGMYVKPFWRNPYLDFGGIRVAQRSTKMMGKAAAESGIAGLHSQSLRCASAVTR